MKRILAGVLAIALLLAGGALAAETEGDSPAAEAEAYAMANISNDFSRQSGMTEEQFFVSMQEIEDIGLGFFSADGAVSMACLYSEDRSRVESTLLFAFDPELVPTLVSCVAAMMFLWDDFDGAESYMKQIQMADAEIVDAMERGTTYSMTCEGAYSCDVELLVTPLGESGNRLNLIVYWNARAEEAAPGGAEGEDAGDAAGAEDSEGEDAGDTGDVEGAEGEDVVIDSQAEAEARVMCVRANGAMRRDDPEGAKLFRNAERAGERSISFTSADGRRA